MNRDGASLPSYGSQVAAPTIPTNPGDEGRGIAFDGTHLYISDATIQNVHKITTGGALVATFSVGVPVAGMTWDPDQQVLWVAAYDSTGKIWAIDPNTGNTVPNTLFNVSSVPAAPLMGIDGLQYDPRDQTFWFSDDLSFTVYHVTKTGALLGSISLSAVPNHEEHTGIAFDGCHLWLARLIHSGTNGSRFEKVTDAGVVISEFTVGIPFYGSEEIEVDAVTFAPDVVLWSHGYGDAADRVRAWSIGRATTTTATDSNGAYSFTGLPSGAYVVSEVLTTGWFQTTWSAANWSGHQVTLSPNQTVNNIDFGNMKVLAWSKLIQPGLFRSEHDPVNVALREARREIAVSDIGPGVERWYSQLNRKDWVTPLLKNQKSRALATRLLGIGRRLIQQGGTLRRADLPVIQEAFETLERAGNPAPEGLTSKVMARLRTAVGRKWPEVTGILAGSRSPLRASPKATPPRR
ncbi:MAG: hypothetical protein M3416_04185 [Acidobacteriota bacterium]|nr:hypothetical protein [Acidobacteriota bacterium]